MSVASSWSRLLRVVGSQAGAAARVLCVTWRVGAVVDSGLTSGVGEFEPLCGMIVHAPIVPLRY